MKKQFMRRKGEMLLLFTVFIATYLFTVAIISFLALKEANEIMGFLAGVIAMATTALTQGFLSAFSFHSEFNLVISMGEVRKSFVPVYQLFSMLELFGTALISYLFGYLEQVIYRIVEPELVVSNELVVVYRLRYVIPVILTIVILEMFVQALLLRYGMKAFWGLWLIWMAVCVGIPQLLGKSKWAEEVFEQIIAFMAQISKGAWCVTGVVLGVGVLSLSWLMLRKQRVTT